MVVLATKGLSQKESEIGKILIFIWYCVFLSDEYDNNTYVHRIVGGVS